MFTPKLCRDGIMRVVERHVVEDGPVYEYTFGLETYEHFVKQAFLKSLRKPVVIEDGLTVKELFRNLRPWAGVLEGLAVMDFEAFAAEAEKPPQDLSDRNKFKSIEVYQIISIDSVPEYERIPKEDNPPDIEDKYFSMETVFRNIGLGSAKVTDRYEFNPSWNNHALLREPETDEAHGFTNYSYSMSFSPVSDYAHLPIEVRPTARLVDESQFSVHEKFISHNEPLLNPNNPFVKKSESNNSETYCLEVEVDTVPTILDTFIYGCFYDWGFSYSPAHRDEQLDEIVEAAKEVEGEDNDSEHWRDVKSQERLDEYDFLEMILQKDPHGAKEEVSRD